MSLSDQRKEEISALESIFADEVQVDDVGLVRISIDRGCGVMLCTFNLPEAYPGSALPVLDLSGAVSAEEAASAEQELYARVEPGLQQQAACSLGIYALHKPLICISCEVVQESRCCTILFRLCASALPRQHRCRLASRWAAPIDCTISALVPASIQTLPSYGLAQEERDEAATAGLLPVASSDAHLEQLQVSEREETARQPQQSAPDQELEAMAARVVSGPAFTERRSTFQAHLCTDVHSVHEVELVRRALLQKHVKIRNATHNILAYRIFDTRTQSYMQSCDDDGENAAGSRLLFLLETMGAVNVVVIVSRWYGGLLMGGQRFKEINHAAQRLLQEHGLDHRHNLKVQGSTKQSGSRAQRRT